MKTILKLIKGTIQFLLSNFSYILAFVAGAWAYSAQPELLSDIAMSVKSFDYAGAWMSTKMFAVDSYMWIKGAAMDLVALFDKKEVMDAAVEVQS